MGRGDLADLALCRGERKSGMAIAFVWNVACVGERDVCLHLAFFRQSCLVELGCDGASRNDAGRKFHISDRRLVDLAIVQDFDGRVGAARTDR